MQKIKPAITMRLHALSQAERKSGVVLRDPPPDTPTFTLHGFRRLHPKSEWRGGRIADTDFLTLNEAALMATRHAGHEITVSDFLRASARAEIVLFAVVRRTIQIQPDDKNLATFEVPAPAVLPLNNRACKELANTKRAKWRSFMSLSTSLDGSPRTRIEGCLTATEPDLETTTEDCRVTGHDVHALADAFCEAPAQPQTAAPERETTEGPPPLTTGDIAFCFDGLRWTESQWRKPLGNKPKWLQACIVIPGQQGVREATWNPVCIAARLVHERHIPARSARARFQTKPQLTPWLDAWKTYEADYLDSD